MALVDEAGQSVITSRIQRILRSGPASGSVYVQTHNSLYELQRAEARRRADQSQSESHSGW